MDTPEEEGLNPQMREAMQDAILNMPLPIYCKTMCGLELSAAQEAMLLSWCKVQMSAVHHNIEIARAFGYTRGRQAGTRCSISLN